MYICDECIGLCNSIIAEYADVAPRRIQPWSTMSDDELLAHIPRIAATAAAVEARPPRLGHGVAAPRGVTWARIGDALGMSRRSAWERFSGEE